MIYVNHGVLIHESRIQKCWERLVRMKDRVLLDTLFQLLFALKTQLSAELVRQGIHVAPMHIRLLKLLNREAPCTAQKLVGIMGRDKAQITRLVQDLLTAELIKRVQNPADKRSQLLSLRARGTAALKKMDLIEDNLVAEMSSEVDVDDKQRFLSVASKFESNLRGDNEVFPIN